MRLTSRVVVAIAALLVSAFILSNVVSLGAAPWIDDITWILGALAVSWVAWLRSGNRAPNSAPDMLWSSIAGAILGFAAGYVVPVFLVDQDPLLALAVTGPLGLVGGAVIGLVYALVKRKRQRAA